MGKISPCDGEEQGSNPGITQLILSTQNNCVVHFYICIIITKRGDCIFENYRL